MATRKIKEQKSQQLTITPMSVFTIKIDTARKYLGSISGVTRLTPTENDVLASIIEFMLLKNLRVIDDQVKNYIIKTFKFENPQTYHNMLHIFRKKKLLVHSHKKTELKPMLLPGTTLEIVFEGPRSVLDVNYTDTPTVTNENKHKQQKQTRKAKTGQYKRRTLPASS
jgi:hypothetical protein